MGLLTVLGDTVLFMVSLGYISFSRVMNSFPYKILKVGRFQYFGVKFCTVNICLCLWGIKIGPDL